MNSHTQTSTTLWIKAWLFCLKFSLAHNKRSLNKTEGQKVPEVLITICLILDGKKKMIIITMTSEVVRDSYFLLKVIDSE